MADPNKPTIPQRCSAFGRFIYNKEKGTVLGRTGKSWGLIILFYIIYYTMLAGFFVGMLSVLLFGIITDEKPLLTGEQSLLRMNPGLGFRPMPNTDSTLVKANISDNASYVSLVNNLNELYNEYSTVNASAIKGEKIKYANCSLSDPQANKNFDPLNEICRLNPAVDWGNCTPATGFGYSVGEPCIVVKMNRVYGWLPDIEDVGKSDHTLLRCMPENDGDKATFGAGQPVYYPSVAVNGTQYGYFSSALFPFLNQPGFTTPAVAVQFPKVRRNVMIMIECRLYNLRNSQYDKQERQAMVRFELLIIDQ